MTIYSCDIVRSDSDDQATLVYKDYVKLGFPFALIATDILGIHIWSTSMLSIYSYLVQNFLLVRHCFLPLESVFPLPFNLTSFWCPCSMFVLS